MRATLAKKRVLLGLLGAAILIPVLYFSYNVGRGMYYGYFLFPKIKAEDHYIAPTRWQDFAFLTIFWTTALVLYFVSFRLLRFAMKPRDRTLESVDEGSALVR
jgi:hypothetical protein